MSVVSLVILLVNANCELVLEDLAVARAATVVVVKLIPEGEYRYFSTTLA